MTTVSEFIAYLQTLPGETTIDVLEEDCSGYSTYVTWVDLDIHDTLEFYSDTDTHGPILRIGTSIPASFIYEMQELLTQPETKEEPNQDIISDIEYLITAFEQGADADDYWLPISDLRDDLHSFLTQQTKAQILESFPLLDDEGLDENVHHCEWLLQQERKRLHDKLSPQPYCIAGDIDLLAQTEQPPITQREAYQRGYEQAKQDSYAISQKNEEDLLQKILASCLIYLSLEKEVGQKPLTKSQIRALYRKSPARYVKSYEHGFIDAEKAHGIGGEE